jgi:hypothetical protein
MNADKHGFFSGDYMLSKHGDVTELIIKAFYVLNYLRATTIEVGLLMNFGPEAKFQRKSYDNARKGNLSWIKQSVFICVYPCTNPKIHVHPRKIAACK